MFDLLLYFSSLDKVIQSKHQVAQLLLDKSQIVNKVHGSLLGDRTGEATYLASLANAFDTEFTRDAAPRHIPSADHPGDSTAELILVTRFKVCQLQFHPKTWPSRPASVSKKKTTTSPPYRELPHRIFLVPF